MTKLLFILLCVTVNIGALSQPSFKPGVRAGLNYANVTNAETNAKKDVYIGAFTEIKFAKFYALQPELNYSRKGAKSKFSRGSDIEIQYLCLTVANKFSPFKTSGLHAIIGPSLNFKLNDNSGVSDYEDFDLGLIGGLGFDFPFGLTFEARYNIGLIDLFGSNINNTVPFEELYLNKVFQIGASYRFEF